MNNSNFFLQTRRDQIFFWERERAREREREIFLRERERERARERERERKGRLGINSARSPGSPGARKPGKTGKTRFPCNPSLFAARGREKGPAGRLINGFSGDFTDTQIRCFGGATSQNEPIWDLGFRGGFGVYTFCPLFSRPGAHFWVFFRFWVLFWALQGPPPRNPVLGPFLGFGPFWGFESLRASEPRWVK